MDYVTADLHFGHARIIEFERHQFRTIEEHDSRIIRALNSVLKPNDTLYILGDVGFREKEGGLASLKSKLSRIECHRKILVMGNHDRFSAIEAMGLGFDEVYKGPIYYPSSAVPGRIILSHRPVFEAYDNPYVINVHGHIHNGEIDAKGYYNVNIHMTRYHVHPMSQFEKIAKKLKSRDERYGSEWYAEFEKKTPQKPIEKPETEEYNDD